MASKILYHGSSSIIEVPILSNVKINKDYGLGFYCTEHLELAKEWSCEEGTDGYANRYELNLEGLSVLDLSDEQFTILNWLAILLENRRTRLSTPIAKRGRDWLIEHFLPDYKDYDVIVGYRADDSYFTFARSFLANEISLKQLGHAMRLRKLGEQYVVKTEKAFHALSFLDYTIADNSIYYAKRKQRDSQARAAYYHELEQDDMEGIFLRDILREEMKSDDPRLQ